MSVGVEVCHLSHIQTPKSQDFSPLFEISPQVPADLAPWYACNGQDKGQPFGSKCNSCTCITEGKKIEDRRKISAQLYFILPLEISSLTHLFLWDLGQNIGDFLRALSLILRCWPCTAWCNLGCISFLRLDKSYWVYWKAAGFLKAESGICNNTK